MWAEIKSYKSRQHIPFIRSSSNPLVPPLRFCGRKLHFTLGHPCTVVLHVPAREPLEQRPFLGPQVGRCAALERQAFRQNIEYVSGTRGTGIAVVISDTRFAIKESVGRGADALSKALVAEFAVAVGRAAAGAENFVARVVTSGSTVGRRGGGGDGGGGGGRSETSDGRGDGGGNTYSRGGGDGGRGSSGSKR